MAQTIRLGIDPKLVSEIKYTPEISRGTTTLSVPEVTRTVTKA